MSHPLDSDFTKPPKKLKVLKGDFVKHSLDGDFTHTPQKWNQIWCVQIPNPNVHIYASVSVSPNIPQYPCACVFMSVYSFVTVFPGVAKSISIIRTHTCVQVFLCRFIILLVDI